MDDFRNSVCVWFTPTIPHCSMATLIGLCIRVKLIRSLPRRFKIEVKISPGTHSSEDAGNCLELGLKVRIKDYENCCLLVRVDVRFILPGSSYFTSYCLLQCD